MDASARVSRPTPTNIARSRATSSQSLGRPAEVKPELKADAKAELKAEVTKVAAPKTVAQTRAAMKVAEQQAKVDLSTAHTVNSPAAIAASQVKRGLSARPTSDGTPPTANANSTPASDDRTGLSGAALDVTDLAKLANPLSPIKRMLDLRAVRNGTANVDPDSRLGAYKATLGYPPGSVGDAVNKAIGTLYQTLGTYGEERIGSVFNSKEAKALYDKRVSSDASRQIAQVEFNYWDKVKTEDPFSAGAQIATQFSVTTRDWLQKNVFASP